MFFAGTDRTTVLRALRDQKLASKELEMIQCQKQRFYQPQTIRIIYNPEDSSKLHLQFACSLNSQNGGFLKIGVPPIIHFNGIFPYKPSIFVYPPFVETSRPLRLSNLESADPQNHCLSPVQKDQVWDDLRSLPCQDPAHLWMIFLLQVYIRCSVSFHHPWMMCLSRSSILHHVFFICCSTIFPGFLDS